MSENYKPYVAFVLGRNDIAKDTVNDAMSKAVKMGVPTKPFRYSEFLGVAEFEQEIAQCRLHVDGVVIIINDLDQVFEEFFENFLKKSINYGIRRFITVYNSPSSDDIDDAIAQDEIENYFYRFSCPDIQFTYITCPVSYEYWEAADEIRPFIEEINKRIVEPAMENNDFRLPIKQVFSVNGLGVVAVGVVLHGSLQAGAEVAILGGEKTLKATVKGFELRRNMVNSVTVGDDTGIFLEGVNAEDINAGMMITSL